MKNKNTQWYPRYTTDYQNKTPHLSLLEHGVYAVMLDHYYLTEKPLPLNEEHLLRICRAFAPQELAAVRSILSQFFVEGGDGYHNVRADEEIHKRKLLSKKRMLAGKMRGSNCSANATAIAPTATATVTYKLAKLEEDVCDTEIIPSAWHTYAEQRGIPDAQIYDSWRRFKERSSMPWRFVRWRGWVEKEKIRA